MAIITDKFIFMHSPKTAGGTIENIILKNNKFLNPKTHKAHWTAVGDFKDTKIYKFFIVRNPWDYLVSHYEFGKQKDSKDIFKKRAIELNFSNFVRWLCEDPPSGGFLMTQNWRRTPNVGYQSHFYYNFLYSTKDAQDKNQKDSSVRVFRFEEGVENIFKKIGKDIGIDLGYEEYHVRATKRKPYKDYYKNNDELVELIGKAEKVIINEYGYEF